MPSVHICPRRAALRRFLQGGPLLGAALLASGCAVDLPSPERHAASTQRTWRAVHHWDVLAEDMAARVAEKTADWPPGEHPIYVVMPGETRFGQGFRKLLIPRLLNHGVTVSMEPSTPVHLVIETQVLQHMAAGSSVLSGIPLAAGVSVSRDGAHSHGADLYAQAAERPMADVETAGTEGRLRRLPILADRPPVVYPRLATPERSEVLVSASLESGGRYLAGTANVYSLAHDDAALYLAAEPYPLRAPPSLAKTWRVVAP